MLTLLGEGQAHVVHDAWVVARSLGERHAMAPPLPQILLSSPLSRSLQTLCISWRNILAKTVAPGPSAAYQQPVFVHENLREVYGKNTCDMRSSRSEIEHRMEQWDSSFRLVCNDGFAEQDPLWTVCSIVSAMRLRRRNASRMMQCARAFKAHSRPCGRMRQRAPRVRRTTDPYAVLSLTCHGGVIQRLLEITGHTPMNAPVGSMSAPAALTQVYSRL